MKDREFIAREWRDENGILHRREVGQELVRCRDCKHRPKKEDPDGANFGFNIIEPTNNDDLCPCLVMDGFYSWLPKGDFFCGYGERK